MTDDAGRVATLRELLPATGAGIYLDTATRGPLPAETAAAMREAEEWELAVGRVWAGRDDDVAQRFDEARAVVAALLGTDPDAVTLAAGIDGAIRAAERRFGVRATVVEHVDPTTGAIASPSAADGTPLIVNATLSAGAIPVAAAALGADAVVLACDRWLLAPEGTAALWMAGARGVAAEAGALPRTALIGLARSVGWLEMYVGLEWVFERTARLGRRLYDALASTAGAELLTPAGPPAAVVTFRIAGWPAADAADELSRRVHSLVRPLPHVEALRASVAWFNAEAELDQFVDAVAELAQYTPATLPRRPALIVLPDR